MIDISSFFYVAVFLFGLVFGSFYNVLIHRIPLVINSKKKTFFSTISYPNSFCPSCKKNLLLTHNIPLLSWLYLSGKCHFCENKISFRYPLVEALTACIFLFSFWRYGLTIECIFWLIFFSILLILFFIDLETFLLPDYFTVSLLIIGILKSILYPLVVDPVNSILGTIFGFFSLYIVNSLYRLWRGVDGFGVGDFKLLAGLGAWFGWFLVIPIIMMGTSVALISVLILSVTGKQFTLKMMIPFGPALIVASIIMYLNPNILLLFI